MNKVIIYTSNIGFTPKTLDEVRRYAEENDKFRIAEVGLNAHLAEVKVGDNIITKKGNSLYVLHTFDKSVDELEGRDAEIVDTLTRNYDLKKSNITSVANRIKFETWCKTARPLLVKSNTNSNKSNMNSIKNFSERLKSTLMPVEAKDVRIATDGNICVATNDGYVAIAADNTLVSYPEEFTIDLPAYIIAKPVEQLQPGDVIARDRSYAKVKAIKDGKITVIGYTGAGSTVYPIKDFLFNQTMVRVVVSLAGTISGQMNPMLLLAMSGKGDSDSMLPLLLMSQQNGAVAANPLLMAAMLGGEKGDLKDLFLYSSLSGQNILGNLFGAAQPSQVAARPTPVTGPAPVISDTPDATK